MAILFPADNLKILDYNRVLKSLGGLSDEEFLEKIRENFDVQPIERDDTKVKAKHQFSLLIKETWYRMILKEGMLDTTSAVSQLDSQIITDKILASILGVEDIKKDPRVEFVGGIRGHEELEKRCQEDCHAAIALYPVEIGDLLKVADNNEIMPPKSTWFEPKPRSGFVVNVWPKSEDEHEK